MTTSLSGCIACMHTFNLPPPHCLDNSPNNQHNCREKSFFFLSKSSYRSRMSLASSYFSSFFFYQLQGSRQSSLCCQTLPPSDSACKEGRQKVPFKIYVESLHREKEVLIGFFGISFPRLFIREFASHAFLALTSVSHR